MEDNRKRIQNLLENVIRASKLLMEKGYLAAQEGNQMIRCLLGIRERFLSDAYMSKSPINQDVYEIDDMILPLDRMLVEAGKKGYQNTISYILKTVVQGAGIGHRILTAEEERNKAVVLLKRKLKVREYMEAIEHAKKLDEKISSRKFILKRQQMLRKDCQVYEEKLEQMRSNQPDLMEELLFYSDMEDMSADALEYIELTASLTKAKNDFLAISEDLENVEYLIQSHMQVLKDAKRWDEIPSKSTNHPVANETQPISHRTEKNLNRNDEISNRIDKEDDIVDVKEFEKIFKKTETSSMEPEADVQDDLISEKKILEMQKLIEKFVDEDNSNMIDLGYDEMERVFASGALNKYVAHSLREFGELGLDDEN